MRINQTKSAPNFGGLYNNKTLLFALDKISNHGASFATAASFVGALALRPLAISLAPKVKNDNKKILTADSVASAFSKLIVGLLVSFPIEGAINKISKNPSEFLKKETIKNISKKEYDFLAQSIKMGANFISAIPKSIIGAALIPVIFDIFPLKKEKQENKAMSVPYNPQFSRFLDKTSFKGAKQSKVVELCSSIINSKHAKEFVAKYSPNDKNIARNASIAQDVLLCATSALATSASKKIDKKAKKPLVLNKICSSALSILFGCSIDKFVQNFSRGGLEKFKKANLNNPNLSKYIQGINILRPTLVFAFLYYGLIPFVSAIVSDKFTKEKQDSK